VETPGRKQVLVSKGGDVNGGNSHMMQREGPAHEDFGGGNTIWSVWQMRWGEGITAERGAELGVWIMLRNPELVTRRGGKREEKGRGWDQCYHVVGGGKTSVVFLMPEITLSK